MIDMLQDIITPKDEQHWLKLRKQDLTSTDVPALFNMSPYKTYYELWHEKAGIMEPEFSENDRIFWGNRLEAAIAESAAEKEGWKVAPFKDYIRLPSHRLGSSFDFAILDDETDRPLIVLEIKNVDGLIFRNSWEVDGDEITAPVHIELQVQHQLLVSGLPKAKIVVFVGGNRHHVLHREADYELHDAIITMSNRFWQSIDEGKAPAPNFETDADAVIRMNQFAEPCKEIEDDGLRDLLQRYTDAAQEEKAAQKKKKALKAEVLTKVGDAEKVRCEGFTVSAGMVSASEHTVTREAYRGFRVYKKKE